LAAVHAESFWSAVVSSSIFSGNSRYAVDFQSIIDRAVALASLPKSLMENQRAALANRSGALSSIGAKVGALKAAVDSVETAFGLSSFSSSVSATNIRTTLLTGVGKGTYTVAVSDAGAYSLATSRDTIPEVPETVIQEVSDPGAENIIDASDFSLELNGEVIATLTGVTSLNSLAAQINENAGGKVHAYIVNLAGGGETPEYHLSVQSNSYGADAIELTAQDVELSDQSLVDVQVLNTVSGSTVKYTVNGHSVESASQTVDLAPGLEMQIVDENDEANPETTITVTQPGASIRTALNSMIATFNAVIVELDKHVGEADGALAGLNIVQSIKSELRGFGEYGAATDDFNTLAAIGIEFASDGRLSLNDELYNQAVENGIDPLVEFLGSAETGGFLKRAVEILDSLTAEETGIVGNEIASLADSMELQDERIAAEQERIDRLTQDLQARMAKADALIASMEQQVSYITGMFESMRVASQALK
jgi:flagellar capping protein FliD